MPIISPVYYLRNRNGMVNLFFNIVFVQWSELEIETETA